MTINEKPYLRHPSDCQLMSCRVQRVYICLYSSPSLPYMLYSALGHMWKCVFLHYPVQVRHTTGIILPTLLPQQQQLYIIQTLDIVNRILTLEFMHVSDFYRTATYSRWRKMQSISRALKKDQIREDLHCSCLYYQQTNNARIISQDFTCTVHCINNVMHLTWQFCRSAPNVTQLTLSNSNTGRQFVTTARFLISGGWNCTYCIAVVRCHKRARTIMSSPTWGQQRFRPLLQPHYRSLYSHPIYSPFFNSASMGWTIFLPFMRLLLTPMYINDI